MVEVMSMTPLTPAPLMQPVSGSMQPLSASVPTHQTWTGYSARPGAESPLRSFFRNYCSSAMQSFITISDAPNPCDSVALPYDGPDPAKMRQIASYAPQPNVNNP